MLFGLWVKVQSLLRLKAFIVGFLLVLAMVGVTIHSQGTQVKVEQTKPTGGKVLGQAINKQATSVTDAKQALDSCKQKAKNNPSLLAGCLADYAKKQINLPKFP
jgi:hypothetical protein